ncbi:hypothetical protein V6N13_120371 [Hibiscus sabdariffa]|uniref:phosphatidate phosphatase n=1 Tax=Hibiscus sabdariffa TaxID=183260 RepID=A0ABR2E420_9ROSI
MYAVGRLGSYISRGVYTVSGPFHPFGGAVDIIVVEQPDGSFKSSPWYVRFGKFQGVLKTREKEKAVSITVNGVEANFNMFLDHKGVAYFLREMDVEEREPDADAVPVSFPLSSGDETDEPLSGNGKPMKSKSCSYDADESNSVAQVDMSNGKLVARTSSRRPGIFGLVFGQRSKKEDNYQEGAGGTGVTRSDSWERAELAAELLEVKWSTNLASNRSNNNASRFSSTNDALDNKGSSTNDALDNKCKVIANLSGGMDDNIRNSDHDENATDAVSGSGMSGPATRSEYKFESCIDKPFDEVLAANENVSDNLQAFVNGKMSESSVITSVGSSEQILETMCLSGIGNGEAHVQAETLLTKTEPMPEVTVLRSAEDMELGSPGALTMSESYLVGADPVIGLEEFKSHSIHIIAPAIDLGDHVENGKNIKDVVHPSLEYVDDSQNFYGDRDPKRSVSPSESSEDEQFLFTDLDAFKFVQENPSINLEISDENARVVSNPISISRNHRLAGEKNGWQVESLPNMWSPLAKFDVNNHHPLSLSLDSSSETMKWTTIKKDDSSCIRSDADKEHPLAHEKSSCEESGTSGKLKNTLDNSAVEISLCKHLLHEGMGAEAACQAFDAEKLDSKKFISLGPAVVKNDRLVVRIGDRYIPGDEAAPILLEMVTFGSEEIFESKGMVPVDRAENSGDPSKAIVSRSRSWRLWPFSMRRSKSGKAVLLAPADTRGLDTENVVDGTAASGNDRMLKPKQAKKMIRAITPTSEQLASLNLKEGMNHITFTFSTNMLGKQQVDARIHLWKWNTRIVISDVDGTITRSDVLGQFMPLVGVDWSQSGVAHLFSAIKENGYQLLFLSARAISQAYITRKFLVNLKQDGKALPDGPIVISPDGLFPSLYREVIRRAPHEFKIGCLEDIKALFPPDCNPFYAGFGNRDTDEISYLKVGIPKGKIFIINPKGEVAMNHCVDKSYSSLHDLVHAMFPPMASAEQEDFNSWNFWKLPPPLINI